MKIFISLTYQDLNNDHRAQNGSRRNIYPSIYSVDQEIRDTAQIEAE
jgi:hypothetical protein